MINEFIQEDLDNIIKSFINWNEFSGKTILITGASGFLPAYMVDTFMLLIERRRISDTKVIALVRNKEKAQKRFAQYLFNKNLSFIYQDVCAPIHIEENVHYIIHAASQASPKYYGIDPVGTLSANVFGTSNMLNLAIEKNVESFLFFSSGEIYGELSQDFFPIKEYCYGYLDPMKIRSCYGESKKMGENMCISWSHQYGVNVKIVRPFHTYGPGMDLTDGRVFADFVNNVVCNHDIVMKSDGLAQRAFCYISDAVIAYFKVLLNGKNGEAYNVGNPDCECSIIELAQVLVSLFPEKKLKVVKQTGANDSLSIQTECPFKRSTPDISKIKAIGWYPKVNLQSGFKRTIESYL